MKESYSEPSHIAAKSHQSCPTLYDPTDGSPPGSTIPVILVEMYPLQNSLLVQWLGLCAFTAEGSGQGAKKITHWKQCQTLFWGAPKSLQMVTAAMKLKDTYSLEGKL